jgi:hypothetical protein
MPGEKVIKPNKKDSGINRILVIAGILICILAAFFVGRISNNNVTHKNTNSSNVRPETEESKADPKKVEFKGSTDTATEEFTLKRGSARIEITYSGTQQIAASLVDSNGETVAFIMSNRVGAYDGSTLEKIDSDGNYSLVVKADGPWTVTIKQ